MNDITVRQMDFGFPEELDPIVIEGAPEESYGLLGLSLLLPSLEPYLIRTMKEARKHVADPRLAAELAGFGAQEGQHYRQHILFNDAFRRFPGLAFERLPEFEAELEADYRRFTETKPLRFNLAYAEGFEALTTAAAWAMFQRGTDPAAHPAAADLFGWHLIEELEHRTVAFDVYEHVHGSYFYRLAVGTFAQWHMGRWIGKVSRYMMSCDERVARDYGGAEGRRRRAREQAAFARKSILPKLLRTYLPNYTPHAIEFTAEMAEMAKMYSERAKRATPVVRPAS